MKITYLIILILFLANSYIICEWNMVYKHYPDNQGLRQDDLDCADSMNCISVSSPGATGSMYFKTTDGGYNWNVVFADSAVKIYNEQGQWIDVEWPKFRAARCIDYVTQDFIVVGHREGQITISKDGGVNWDSTNLNTGDFEKIKFIDENYGVAFGGYRSLFKTYNGGHNWEKIDLDYYNENQEINGTSEVYIELVGKDSLIVFNYHYRDTTNIHYTSFSTIDGGETWEQGGIIPYLAGEPFFLNMNEGWLAGRFKTDASKYNDIIFHTTNGGKTWETQLDTFLIPYKGLQGVDFSNNLNGIAWGESVAWITTNGGIDWVKDPNTNTIVNNSFKKMVFPNKNFNKRIANTTLAGAIWLYEDLTSVNEDEKKQHLTIYPMPSSDYINITNIGFDESVEIFDVLGNKVIDTKYNGKINISSLPIGVYFIHTGSQRTKFIKGN